MKNTFSIKNRMLLVLMCLVVPLLIYLAIYNIVTVRILDQKLAESGYYTMNLYNQMVEGTMSYSEKYLGAFVADNQYFNKIAYSKNEKLDNYLAAYEIKKDYENLKNTDDNISAMLIISLKNEICDGVFCSVDSSRARKTAILESMKSYLDKGSPVYNAWIPLELCETNYLCRILYKLDTYAVCMIDMDHIYDNYLVGQEWSGASLVFYDTSKPYDVKATADRNSSYEQLGDIDLYYSDRYYKTGKNNNYMVLQKKTAGSQAATAFLIPYDGFLAGMDQGLKLLTICSFFLMSLVPVGYYMLKRTFFRPVDRLVHIMEEIKAGKWEEASNMVYKEEEFQQVNDIFLDMLSEIKNLKIGHYEKELEVQQVRLQYYQIQIRPHFYLNCLKDLYGLAQMRDYEIIQETILCLSKHLRYMLKDDRMEVTLTEELEYVKNYITLQRTSLKYPPECFCDVEERLNGFLIPPISILTFVENSVKYYEGEKNDLYIKIKAVILESEATSMVNISISDNGNGFVKSELDKLNHIEEYSSYEGHVGIYNVIRRFKLYYGNDRVWFAFSNQSGALIDIFILLDDKPLTAIGSEGGL